MYESVMHIMYQYLEFIYNVTSRLRLRDVQLK